MISLVLGALSLLAAAILWFVLGDPVPAVMLCGVGGAWMGVLLDGDSFIYDEETGEEWGYVYGEDGE